MNREHTHRWAVGSDRCQSPGCNLRALRGPIRFLSKQAKPGTRVRHVLSGATGTFVRSNSTSSFGAIVDWDDRGFGVVRGRVVAPDFDLEEVPAEKDS